MLNNDQQNSKEEEAFQISNHENHPRRCWFGVEIVFGLHREPFCCWALEGYGTVGVKEWRVIEETTWLTNWSNSIGPLEEEKKFEVHYRKHRYSVVMMLFTSPFGVRRCVAWEDEPKPEVEAVLLFMNLVIRSGSWSLVFLIENQCSNHIFQLSNSGYESDGVEELVLTFPTIALLRD
ncbi:hypothetical protein Tco_0103827 [Tanacetum coccineum]